MTRCLMLYEHTVRDLPSYERAAKTLRSMLGEDAVVDISSFHYEWAKETMRLRKTPPDLVIAPWMRWSPHFDLMWPFYKANKNVKFLILNQEQLGSPCSYKLLLPQNSFAREGVYHCAWTEQYANKLIDDGVPKQNIYITGNPKLQEISQSCVARNDLERRFGLDASKRWLLYAESRNVAVMRGEYFQERQRRCGITQEDINANLKYYEDSLSAFYDQLWEIPEAFYEQNELIYRLHPGMRLDRELPSNVRVIEDLPISDWLPNIDVLLTPGSTTVFEAEIAGTPAVVVNSVPFNERYIVEGVGEYVSVNRVEEIDEEVIRRAKTRIQEAPIFERYVGDKSVDGAKAIAEAAFDVLRRRPALETKVPKWNPRVGVRFFVWDAIVYVMAKTGMLGRVKWPRSAYHSIRDLPSGWLRNQAQS